MSKAKIHELSTTTRMVLEYPVEKQISVDRWLTSINARQQGVDEDQRGSGTNKITVVIPGAHSLPDIQKQFEAALQLDTLLPTPAEAKRLVSEWVSQVASGRREWLYDNQSSFDDGAPESARKQVPITGLKMALDSGFDANSDFLSGESLAEFADENKQCEALQLLNEAGGICQTPNTARRNAPRV